MKKFNVWIPYFTRSEGGPLMPLVKELKDRKELNAVQMELKMPKEVPECMRTAFIEGFLDGSNRTDLVLASFDRPEMIPVAYEAYHRGIPVAQIFAGDIAGGAYDDADRFVISQYASLLFCATQRAAQRVSKAVEWRRKLRDFPKVSVVGATHFDDMQTLTDNSPELPPFLKGKFDLVLYNPPSFLTADEIKDELLDLREHLNNRPVVWIAPNGDRYSELIKSWVKTLDTLLNASFPNRVIYWKEDLPRRIFLTYLKHCHRFVGNSSTISYEAVYFDKATVQIGMRNRFREPMPKKDCKPGASKKITDIIIKYLEEEHGNFHR